MRGWLKMWRNGLRACVQGVLALHLVVAQAAMVPTPSVAPAAAEPPAAVAHCHESAVDEGPAPVTSTHCDPGHCHCPVAMAQDSVIAARTSTFLRRIPRGLLETDWPSLRQAPDTRPPIAA